VTQANLRSTQSIKSWKKEKNIRSNNHEKISEWKEQKKKKGKDKMLGKVQKKAGKKKTTTRL